MGVVLVIVTVLAAGIAVMSGVMKLQGRQEILDSLTTVKVPLSWAPMLAGAEFAGAAGALLGLVVRQLGIVATAGLALYFALALGSHLRVGDFKGVGAPVFPLAVSVGALVLRIAVS